MKVCGPCTLCCQVLEIPELAKPAGVRCPHANAGCGIYPDRPTPCRTFTCGWLALEALGEAWRPDIAGFLIRDERDRGQLCIDVDPARPDAWQSDCYIGQIKEWARMTHDQTGCVLVYIADRVCVVFPEETVVLGVLPPHPQLLVGYVRKGGRHRPLVRLLDGDHVEQEWVGNGTRQL